MEEKEKKQPTEIASRVIFFWQTADKSDEEMMMGYMKLRKAELVKILISCIKELNEFLKKDLNHETKNPI